MKHKYYKADTIIEVVIAMMILGGILTLTMASVTRANKTTRTAKERIQAGLLVQSQENALDAMHTAYDYDVFKDLLNACGDSNACRIDTESSFEDIDSKWSVISGLEASADTLATVGNKIDDLFHLRFTVQDSVFSGGGVDASIARLSTVTIVVSWIDSNGNTNEVVGIREFVES